MRREGLESLQYVIAARLSIFALFYCKTVFHLSPREFQCSTVVKKYHVTRSLGPVTYVRVHTYLFIYLFIIQYIRVPHTFALRHFTTK